MVARHVQAKGTPGETDAETRVQEALARMKSAMDRRAAIVDVLSRVGVSPQDKRMAQAEGRKVDRDLREAKRLLQEAQALGREQ